MYVMCAKLDYRYKTKENETCGVCRTDGRKQLYKSIWLMNLNERERCCKNWRILLK
jgi:hypothetical protein